MDEEQNVSNPQDTITDAIEATGAQQASDDSLVFLFPTDPTTPQSAGGISERGALLDDPSIGQTTDSGSEPPEFEDSLLSGQTTDGLTEQLAEEFQDTLLSGNRANLSGSVNELVRGLENASRFLFDLNGDGNITRAEVGIGLTLYGFGGGAAIGFRAGVLAARAAGVRGATNILGAGLAEGAGQGLSGFLLGAGPGAVANFGPEVLENVNRNLFDPIFDSIGIN